MRKLLMATLVVVALTAVPAASASTAFPASQDLLGNGSVTSNGWQGKKQALWDASANQNVCASLEIRFGVTSYSYADAKRLAKTEHGSAEHAKCMRALRKSFSKVDVKVITANKSQVWKANGCSPRAATCTLQVQTPTANGADAYKRKKVTKKTKMVEVTKKSKGHGKAHRTSRVVVADGINDCWNHSAEIKKFVREIVFRLRFRFGFTGQAPPKNPTDAPTDTGQSEPSSDPGPKPTDDNNPPSGGSEPTKPPSNTGGGNSGGDGGTSNDPANPRR